MEGNRLKIVAITDPNYMRALETAIRVGNPILLKVCLHSILKIAQKVYAPRKSKSKFFFQSS